MSGAVISGGYTMIPHFFEHQLDYIFFFYGLAFIILGAICIIIRRDNVTSLPWVWLGLFGFSHGINEWFDMIALSVSDSIAFSYLRLAVMALSFFFLLEFGRRGVARLGGAKVGIWVYIPVGVFVIIGASMGFTALNGAIRYSMGLPGGLWAAWALWRASNNITFRNIFRYAALFTALYAVATGFIVPKSAFLLAPIINHTVFFELTGFPVQLIRGILAICITTAFWYYYQSLRQLMLLRTEIPTTTAGREGGWISIALLVIILGGWGFTEYTGKHEEAGLRNEVFKQGTILAASLHPEHINALSGTNSDAQLTDYIHIREQLRDTIDASPHIRWIKLVLMRDNQYLFVTFNGDSPIGQKDAYKQYAGEFSGIFKGEPFSIGPYSDKNGSFLSVFVPVYSHDTGQVIAALGIDIDAADWKRKVAEHRIMPILIVLLVSIILISFFVIRQRLMETAQLITKEEKQLEEAQRIAHSGSWTWNVKTNDIYWSNELYHIFGLDPESVNSDYNLFINMVHPDDREAVKHAVYEAIYNNQPYRIEHRVILPGGETKVIYGQGETKYDHDKNPTQLIGTMQDITERKIFEEKLRKSEEKYRIVSDFTYDWEYWQGPDRIFRYISPSCEHLTGYTAKEFTDNPELFREIVEPEDRGIFENHLNNFGSGDKVCNLDFRIISKGGEARWVNHICRPVYADNGDFLGRRVTNRDITERKLYERQLREANATKDKFFSIIAHDLKNPFNTLLGASETLSENIDDLETSEIKDISRMINRNAKNAYSLLENLLTWSRAQLGRIEFKPQMISLNEVVVESLKAVEGQAGAKGIGLLNKSGDTQIYADSNLLKTILRNLLSNAIKYTDAGGSVTVSSRQTSQTGGETEISVSDTGVGISPDIQDKLFRIDTKYSTPGTAKETGTGLGLILCREFVEKHGGRIWAESPGEGGKGTTFRFALPGGHND